MAGGSWGEFSFGPKALGVDLWDLQPEILIMDEHQKKLNQRHEGRPRKVRFKISSSYSGRVLKQVYEDGQELEPPAKEHSRRFLRHSFEPGDHFCGAGEMPENRFFSPAKLSAQRISIFKEDKKYSLTSNSALLGDCQPSDSHCRVSHGLPGAVTLPGNPLQPKPFLDNYGNGSLKLEPRSDKAQFCQSGILKGVCKSSAFIPQILYSAHSANGWSRVLCDRHLLAVLQLLTGMICIYPFCRIRYNISIYINIYT